MRPLSIVFRSLAASMLMAAARAAAGEAAVTHADFLDSPAVIGLGQWQFDPAFPMLPGPHDRVVLQSTPHVAAFHIAVDRGQAMELRAAAAPPPVERPLENANDRMRRLRGFSDVSLGAKWRVRGGDAGWLPGVAWLADVEATMGSPAFRDRQVRPSLRATAQWELPARLTLGVMPGVYRDRGADGKHFAAGVLAVTLGKAWTPRLQGFVELAGQRLSRSQAGASLLNVDTGIAFSASRTLEMNLVVSRSLSGNASQQWRAGLSVSSRF